MKYQHPLKSRDLLLATEAVVTPSLPSSDRSGAESGGDEKSSGKKSQSKKLQAAVQDRTNQVLCPYFQL